MEAFGSRLRAARSFLQITDVELSEISEVPLEVIRRIELGETDHADLDKRSIENLLRRLRHHGVRFVERGDVVDAPGMTFDRDPDELLDETQVIQILENACLLSGSVQSFANECGTSASAVYLSLSGKRRVHGRIAKALGIHPIRHVHYVDKSGLGAHLTPSQARARLQDAVEKSGSQTAFAEIIGVEKSTISNQLAGRHLIGGKVAAALELEPVRKRVYRRNPVEPKRAL